MLVRFLVLVDSNFEVTLRQPYPGIFAFFLWGLLLARLRTWNQAIAAPRGGVKPERPAPVRQAAS